MDKHTYDDGGASLHSSSCFVCKKRILIKTTRDVFSNAVPLGNSWKGKKL